MSYFANVINVMIASPSDVSNERQISRNTIQEWNSIHSEDKKIVLMPTGWETHSSPKMGERAQEIINKQVLEHCDLLIAIFWTRLGSPTGDSPSGTVEEIDKHVKTGKPAMIYFSSAPVRPDSVDEEQYKALKEFRNHCEQEGLIETYKTIPEFEDKFSRQLAQTILRYFPPTEVDAYDVLQSIISSQNQAPNLSDEAKQLIIEAAADSRGRVWWRKWDQGESISTNGKKFGEKGNPRSEAKWEAAINQLIEFHLIKDVGYKKEVFTVTDEGYRAADLLKE